MNKIKASYKYQLYENIRPMIIYYIIFIAVVIISFISMYINTIKSGPTEGYADISGSEMSTIIFIFVIGIVALRESFGMMMQNSVSRKSFFIGRLLTCISIGLIMAFVDNIIVVICKEVITNVDPNFSWTTLFENLYNNNVMEKTGFMFMIEGFTYTFLVYLCSASFGYVLSLIFYRVNRVVGLTLKIGIPVGVFFILPTFDSLYSDGRIGARIGDLIDKCLGISSHKPLYGIITFIISFLVLSLISWLLIRRATVKE